MDVALPPREDEDEGDNYSYEYSDARSEESSEELDAYMDGTANVAGPAPPIAAAASNGDRAAGIVAALQGTGGLPQVSAGQASGILLTEIILRHLPCLMHVTGRIRGQGGGGPMRGEQGGKQPRGRDTGTHTRAQSIMHG